MRARFKLATGWWWEEPGGGGFRPCRHCAIADPVGMKGRRGWTITADAGGLWHSSNVPQRGVARERTRRIEGEEQSRRPGQRCAQQGGL